MKTANLILMMVIVWCLAYLYCKPEPAPTVQAEPNIYEKIKQQALAELQQRLISCEENRKHWQDMCDMLERRNVENANEFQKQYQQLREQK